MEVWKKIIGFENYEISNLGTIRTYKGYKKADKSKLYDSVSLYCKNKSKRFYIHRLVAIHFISNPSNKPCVNHIDGDKSNNSVNNLEWVTHKENNRHAWDVGLKTPKVGESSKINKIPEYKARIIKQAKQDSKGKRYWGLKELCIKLNVSYGSGCEISKGNNWKHITITK